MNSFHSFNEMSSLRRIIIIDVMDAVNEIHSLHQLITTAVVGSDLRMTVFIPRDGRPILSFILSLSHSHSLFFAMACVLLIIVVDEVVQNVTSSVEEKPESS